MQGDADGAIAHRKACGGLVDRGAVHGDAIHHIALSGRQLAQMAADIGGDRALALLGAGQDLGEIIDRDLDPAAATA